MRNAFFLAATALLAGASPAFAQQETEPEQPAKNVREVYRAVEEHDEGAFREVEIDGSFRKPGGRFIGGRGDEKFDTIIDERVHFKRDLAKSIGVRVKIAETTAK